MYRIKGPSVKKLFGSLEKNFRKSIYKSMDGSADLLQAKAQADSPVLTGRFKKAIKQSRVTRSKLGIKKSVGVRASSKAVKYGFKVEKKYSIFKKLAYKQQKPVNSIFIGNLVRFSNQRIN